MEVLKNAFIWVKNTSRLSLYNPVFVIILGWITFFSWLSGNALLGMGLLIAVTCFVLIINEDILPVLPCLFFIMLTVSDNNILNQKNAFPIIIVLVIFLIGSIISHFISYPLKFKKHKLTLPLIAISVALLLGGAGFLTFKQYLYGVTFILALGPCMLALYFLIISYINPPKEIDFKKYICFIMFILGLIIIGQIAIYFLRAKVPIIDMIRNDIQLGWGNRNSAAMILVMTFPCCFYLAFCSKKLAWFFYSMGYLIYGVMMFTFSRGGMLAGTLIFVCLLIYSFAKGANRSQLLIVTCVISILLSIFVLVKQTDVANIIQKIINMDFTTSGRDVLYQEAIENFVQNPVFGAGLGYIGSSFNMPDFCIYWYHSTIFQVIGSMGIVGIFAYAYFYFSRGLIMFKSLKRFNIIISLGLIAFEIHSLFDTGTFTPFPFMLIVIALTAVLEYNNTTEKMSFMKSVQINNL